MYVRTFVRVWVSKDAVEIAESTDTTLKNYPPIRIVRIFHRPIGNIFVLIIVRNTIIEKCQDERRSELNKKEEEEKEKK